MVRHSKDRLFITATEWKEEYGGKKAKKSAGHRPLPFDHCALSLSPFHTPTLIGTTGVVFDFENIVPFIQKYKSDPVSGNPASTKDILRLNMAKNSDGAWHCPITCKVFTNNTHIVAIRQSGNVYSYDAVNELNLKSKSMIDLISGEAFKKSDIISLQDPQNAELMSLRDINNFEHLKTIREEHAESCKADNKVKGNSVAQSVMKEIADKRQSELDSGVKKKTTEEILKGDSSDYSDDVAAVLALNPTTDDVNPGQVNTDGKAGISFTSSASGLHTSNATRLATAEEVRQAKWKIMRSLGKKAFVQLQTTVGNLNLEIHSDITMRTAYNFLTLCNEGYYDGTIFHRLIPGFMVQGGDPSGEGTGGESAFKAPFKDEFDARLSHASRGVLSMANAGLNSNNSQFFITFKECKHLDMRHTVFGRVVGGLSNLDRIEAIAVGKNDKPREEIKILKAVVFTNPVDEAEQMLLNFVQENISRNKQKLSSRTTTVGGSSSSSSASVSANQDRAVGIANASKAAMASALASFPTKIAASKQISNSSSSYSSSSSSSYGSSSSSSSSSRPREVEIDRDNDVLSSHSEERASKAARFK